MSDSQGIDECDCHEWHDVAEIGEWPHGLAGGRASQPKAVREIVATEPIWDSSELPREELTARIIAVAWVPAGTKIKATCGLASLMRRTNGVKSGLAGGNRSAPSILPPASVNALVKAASASCPAIKSVTEV